MNKHVRWLMSEIDRWEAEGLMSKEQAGRLRQNYEHPAAATIPWGLLVFATAGAVVIGLGVVLLFAYNWAEIPKLAKLALVFLALIGTHSGALRLLSRDGWQARLGEACVVFGTMLYGAGIWLVAQIYNIDEHYPNGFLFWGLGALAMAWALRSVANGLLAVVLVAIWGACEVFGFRQPQYWPVMLIAGGLLPLAWQERSALLLAGAIAAIQFLIAVNVGYWGAASARLTEIDVPDFPAGATVMNFLGFAVFLVCAFMLSFKRSADDLLDWSRVYGSSPRLASAFGWSLFGSGLAGWAWLARRSLLQREFDLRREEWLLPIALLYCFGIAFVDPRGLAPLVSWSFNLILLGLATMWIWRGCQESRLRPTVFGSLLLGAVVLARYFDLFQNLAARGLAFIVLGIVFVAEAMYYRKVRRTKEGAV
jgi:uncharacterized membrane protein